MCLNYEKKKVFDAPLLEEESDTDLTAMLLHSTIYIKFQLNSIFLIEDLRLKKKES